MVDQFVTALGCKDYNTHEPLQHLLRRRPAAHYYQCYYVNSKCNI